MVLANEFNGNVGLLYNMHMYKNIGINKEYKIFELPVINSNHSFLGIISESILKSKPTNKKLEELHSFFNTESVQSHNHIYEIIEKA